MEDTKDKIENSNTFVHLNANNSKLIDSVELDKMLVESLKDVNLEDDTDDLESDTELLRQLEEITRDNTEEYMADVKKSPNLSTSAQHTAEVLKQRIQMYEFAKTNAKESGDNAKVRRLNRGLTRLNSLLSQTYDGEEIEQDDIPPEVITKIRKEAVEQRTK